MDKKILDTLVENWNRCGIERGDTVLVHSSLLPLLCKIKDEFKKLATPQLIYDSLVVALGESGTLVLPLFNFDFTQTGYFSIKETPSQMGALTEIGRKDAKAVRTGHPIYSFAVIGKGAGEFESIDNKSGYGADSPFAKIKDLNGKIAVLGLPDQGSMTSYHFVEEQTQVDYRYYKDFSGTYVDKMGNRSNRVYSLYVRNIEKGVVTEVNRMMDYLWSIGAYKGDKHTEGYTMRTILFETFYKETEKKIRNGEAINFLYTTDK